MATWVVLAAIEFAVLGVFTWWLLRYYAAKTVPLVAWATVFVSWYLGFFGCLFLPIDIAEAYYSIYTNFTNTTEIVNTTEAVGAAAASVIARLPADAAASSSELGAAAAAALAAGVGGVVQHVASAAAAAAGALHGGAIAAAARALVPAASLAASVAGASAGSPGWARALQGPPPDPPGNDTGNGTIPEFVVVSEEVQMRNGPMESMWWAVYVITFLLTYVVLPVVQEYAVAGEFTWRERLRTAVVINLVFYAVVGVLGMLGLAYVVIFAGAEMAALFRFGMVLANTYGLVLVILLLGYGTAEVPRALWRAAFPRAELERLHFAAPEAEASLFDARSEMADVLAAVREMAARVGTMAAQPAFQAGDGLRELAELQHCLEVVQAKAALEPHALDDATAARAPGGGGGRGGSSRGAGDDEDAEEGRGGCLKRRPRAALGASDARKALRRLAVVHKRLLLARAKLAKMSFRWHRLVHRAIELEFVLARRVPPVPVRAHKPSGGEYWASSTTARGRSGGAEGAVAAAAPDGSLSTYAVDALRSLSCANAAVNALLWRWKISAAPYAFIACAVLAELLSLLLLESEATIGVNLSGAVKQNLSVFGILLYAADVSSDHSYFLIQIVAAIPLGYMCLTSAYSLWRLRFFDMLDLTGERNSDAYSLCINAVLFNRLQFALGFNYLNVLMHSTDRNDFPPTAFMFSVGAGMKLSYVDWWLPMAIPAVYVAAKANLFERFMRVLGVDEKSTPDPAHNEKHREIISDGQRLVERARRQLGLDAAALAGAGEGGGSGGGGADDALAERLRGRAASGNGSAEELRRVAGTPGGGRASAYKPPAAGDEATPAGAGGRRAHLSIDSFATAPIGGGGGVSSGGARAASVSSAPITAGAGGGGGGGARVGVASAPAPSGLPSWAAATAAAAPEPRPWAATGAAAPAESGGGARPALRPLSSLMEAPAAGAGAGGGSLAAKLKGKRPGYGQLD